MVEFDISIWGNQCNHLLDKTWDIGDNVNAKWVSTGAACPLLDKQWNHITIQAQRESDNTLLSLTYW